MSGCPSCEVHSGIEGAGRPESMQGRQCEVCRVGSVKIAKNIDGIDGIPRSGGPSTRRGMPSICSIDVAATEMTFDHCCCRQSIHSSFESEPVAGDEVAMVGRR